jgi:hypothetical protein
LALTDGESSRTSVDDEAGMLSTGFDRVRIGREISAAFWPADDGVESYSSEVGSEMTEEQSDTSSQPSEMVSCEAMMILMVRYISLRYYRRDLRLSKRYIVLSPRGALGRRIVDAV